MKFRIVEPGAKADAVPLAAELKIELMEVRPVVWRRVVVKADIRLSALHKVIQNVMPWTDAHLHEFETAAGPGGERFPGWRDGQRYAPPDPENPDPDVKRSSSVKLSDVAAKPGDKLIYMYDFGDGWEHTVIVENVRTIEKGEILPRCVAGANACPPEDCGGPYGYEELLEILRDPAHPEYQERKEWCKGLQGVPGPFDPLRFSVEETNRSLKSR